MYAYYLQLQDKQTVPVVQPIVHVTQDKQTIHCMPIVPTITGPTVQFVCLLPTITGQTNYSLYARCTV